MELKHPFPHTHAHTPITEKTQKKFKHIINLVDNSESIIQELKDITIKRQ